MILQKSTERTPLSEGEHYLKLTHVEMKRMQSQYPDEVGDGMANRLIVHFISSKTDEMGVNETHDQILPAKISSANATGKFFHLLFPALDFDKVDFDPEEHVGKVWQCLIVHEQGKTGRTYARIVKAAAWQGKAKPKPEPKPADDGFSDPFENE